MFGSRKHRLGGDTYRSSHKRIKLDSLLEDLHLDEPPRKKPHRKEAKYEPVVESVKFIPTSSKTTIENLVAASMLESYHIQMAKDLALLRWVPIPVILGLHFQRWVKRLFNAFVRRFNANNSGRKPVPYFRTYEKIMRLVEDQNSGFTINDLRQILMEQNLREQHYLEVKRDKKVESKKLEEIREGEQLSRKIRYNYWDRFADVVEDSDMLDVDEESGQSTPQVEEVDALMSDLDANYGMYYEVADDL